MILRKRLFIIAFVNTFILMIPAAAQTKVDNDKGEGIILTVQTGISHFFSEMARDFSGFVTEFESQPGVFGRIEASLMVTTSLEAGVGVKYSNLNGHTNNPDFTAIGVDHILKTELEGPVQFINRLYGPEVFGRYRFGPDSKSRTGVFVKAGGGLLINESELFYKDRTGDEIIFGKGKEKSTSLVNGVLILGSGLKYDLTRFISFHLATDLNIVKYDFLDVVHNYDAGGNRCEVIGMFYDLSAGISIRFGGPEIPPGLGKKRSSSGMHLPFSPR